MSATRSPGTSPDFLQPGRNAAELIELGIAKVAPILVKGRMAMGDARLSKIPAASVRSGRCPPAHRAGIASASFDPCLAVCQALARRI